MLINGLQIKENGVIVAGSHTSCHLCAMKYHSEHKEASLSECYDAVRGEQVGKPVKVLNSLRDPNGEKVCICSDCAQEIVNELKGDNSKQ